MEIEKLLLTYNFLASELSSDFSDCRKFITLSAYKYESNSKIKKLSPDFKRNENVYYSYNIYEVPQDVVKDSDLFNIKDENIRQSIRAIDIKSFRELINQLSGILPSFDLNNLVPFWRISVVH